MKYILWFTFYILDNDAPLNVRTFILVEKDSVFFYIKDVGYTSWHIDEVVELNHHQPPNHSNNNDYFRASFIISNNLGFKGVILIAKSRADISLFFDGHHHKLSLARISKRKLKEYHESRRRSENNL